MTVKEEPQEDAQDGLLNKLLSGNHKDVVFAPLYGARESDHAFCSVLRIEGIVCLLDCGWNEACDVSMLAPLAAVAPHVQLVLLSHANISHTGALPYAVAKLGLKAEIYASLPVRHLGHLSLYELLASKQDCSDFDLFSFDDIDNAFDKVQGVRFNQQLVQSKSQDGGATEDAACPDVRFTAHAAGHSLGGALWHLQVLNQDFLYAVSLNLKNDRHLNGCSMQQRFHRPALLITDALCAGRTDPDPEQGTAFCRCVVSCLRQRDGHVLIPVDTAARVLELLLLLEWHWASQNLQYPLVFLAKTASSVVDKARAQLEFLWEKVQQQFARGKGTNPFELPHVRCIGHLEALNTLPIRTGLVVLAPAASLNLGMARELLFHYGWADNPQNSIVMPLGNVATGSVAEQIARFARSPQAAFSALQIKLEVGYRVPLTPEEEAARQAEEETKRLEQAQARAQDSEMAGTGEDSEDELEQERQNTGSVAVQTAGGGQVHHAVHDEPAARTDPAFDGVLIDGFKVPEGAIAPMFPDPAPRNELDEFGEVTDLAALCGRHFYADEDADSDIGVGEDRLETHLDLPLMDTRMTKLIQEVRMFTVTAAVHVFDFSSVISQSSFLSMLKHVAPRNLVLLQQPPVAPPTQPDGLLPRVRSSLAGLHSRIHTPAASEAIALTSTDCYVAAMTAELCEEMEAADKVMRPPYRLGWLDSVVAATEPHTGRPVLGVPEAGKRDLHSGAGVLLGNMMVSEVTQRLKRKGMQVDQEGEVALVNEGEVVVKQEDKDNRNEIVIEGGLSLLYYQVREQVYQQYRLVTPSKPQEAAK